ncbi:MAG: hypothetical protein ACYC5F_05990 [Thermoleophilia bacterium]
MQVPDELRKCVAFAFYEGPLGLTKLGTVFFVNVPIEVNGVIYYDGYIVTARHLIARIREKSSRSEIMLRINQKDGTSTDRWIDLDEWKFHPQDSSVDVAAMSTPDEFWATGPFDIRGIPITMAVTEDVIRNEVIEVGDEIFLTGLFSKHTGVERNLPIVRIGNIARMPEERIPTKYFGNIEAYLVEVRSIGGLSGSPVFINLGTHRLLREFATEANPQGRGRRHIQRVGPIFYWLGMMHGHWDLPAIEEDAVSDEDAADVARINTGIGVVVPVSQILEIISQPYFLEMREREISEINQRNLPVEDLVEEMTEADFDEALKRASRPKPGNDQEES